MQRTLREPSRQAAIDAQLSQISRATNPKLNEDIFLDDDDDRGEECSSPLVDDFILSGHPSGGRRGPEVPWNFNAEPEDEEDELIRLVQMGLPTAVEKMVVINDTEAEE